MQIRILLRITNINLTLDSDSDSDPESDTVSRFRLLILTLFLKEGQEGPLRVPGRSLEVLGGSIGSAWRVPEDLWTMFAPSRILRRNILSETQRKHE